MLVDTVGRMAREGFTITDRKVRFGAVSCRHDARQPSDDRDQAGPGLRLRQDRARGAGRGAARGGVALVSTGARPRLHRGARHPGHQGRGPDRLPRVPRRPGQDAAPEGARRHPGRPAPRRPTSRSSRSSASSRSTWWSRTSTRSPRRCPRGATPDECVEQIDIGGPSMVRAAAKNHPSVAIVTSPGAVRDVLAAVARRRLHPRRSASGWPPRRSCTPRRTTWRRVAGWAACSPTPPTAPASRPGSARPGTRRRCCATARTRTSAAALYSTARPGRASRRREQLHGKEMSYNNYVDADAARRAAYDFAEPAVAIIKHANPCGIAVGADVAEAHRKAHACDPVSAFGGVIATNRPVSVAMAEQVAEIFTEVVVAPGVRGRAPSRSWPRKKNIRVLSAPPTDAAGGVETRPISGGLLMQQRATRSTPTATTRPTWTLAAGEAASDADARRPRVRLAGLPRGEVQRDPARHRRRLGRRRHGPGQPGRLVPARGRAGGGAGGGLGGRVRRVLPVRRRPAGPDRRRASARSSSPAARSATTRSSRRCEAAGVTMYFTGTRHFFH